MGDLEAEDDLENEGTVQLNANREEGAEEKSLSSSEKDVEFDSVASHSSPSREKFSKETFSDYDSDQLTRFKVMIQELRIERETLLDTINSLEMETEGLKQKNRGQSAEIEELKIELEVMKQRHYKESEAIKESLSLSERKKTVLE